MIGESVPVERPSQEDLRRLAGKWLPPGKVPDRFRIHTDTTDFFRVEYDDVLILEETPYLVRHNAREGRFGLDDEVKHWVRRAVDLNTGDLKIIKMVFYEKFTAHVGEVAFECFRSPRKEARILDLVRGRPHFMQGISVKDSQGNLIRVLDFIKGAPLTQHVLSLGDSHEDYFYGHFPKVLDNFIECAEAVRFLHDHGEKHGDIRRDHILVARETGEYCWIDFDYNYRHRENIYAYDLFGLGNILVYLVGRGDVLLTELDKNHPSSLDLLTEQDVNIVFNNRVVNLAKVNPYIPRTLNLILLHFAKGARRFYETTGQFLEDLHEARDRL